MKWTPALFLCLALATVAAPASAQRRDDGFHGRPSPQVFRPPQTFRPQIFRPPPNYPPPRDQRPPQVFSREPPGPYGPNDSLGAGWGPQQDEVRQGVTQRRFIPLGQAIGSISRRVSGRELDAGLEQWEGRPAYRVRWAASDGSRIDYIVDAESGAILNVEGGP